MNDKNAMEAKKSKLVKIIIPIALICIVFGIWIVKNSDKNIGQQDIGQADIGSPDFAFDVTEEIDLEKLKSYGLPIIINFGAESCAPCRAMAPGLKELNIELQGKAIVKFVDVWKYQNLAQGFPISLIPTQIFIDANGNPYTPSNPEAMQMKLYSHRDTNEHIFTAHEGAMMKPQLLSVLKEMGLK